MDSKQLALTLHTLLCKKKHTDAAMDLALSLEERDPNVCYFLIERQLEDKWDKPAHIEWTKKAEQAIDLLGFEDNEELLDKFLNQLLGIMSQILWLEKQFPGTKDFIRTVLLESLESFKTAKTREATT